MSKTQQKIIEYQDRVIRALLKFAKDALEESRWDLLGFVGRSGPNVRGEHGELCHKLAALGIEPTEQTPFTDDYGRDASYNNICIRDVRRGLDRYLHHKIDEETSPSS